MTAISLLLLVGLFSAAGAIMAYYFLKNPDILFAGKNQTSVTANPIKLKFEDGDFSIPEYLVRKVRRSPLRKVKKISLVVPIDWSANHAPVAFTSKSDLSQWLLAEIDKRSSFLSDAERLNKIFRLYIADPAIIHSSGLYRYRFKSGSPYDSIELFIDDLQTPKFIIRCEMQNALDGTRLCNRHLPVSSRLTMLYKFPRSQINQWQQVHRTMETLRGSIFKRNGV